MSLVGIPGFGKLVGEEIRGWGRLGKVKEAKQPGTMPVKAGAWISAFWNIVACCQEQHLR